MSTHDSGRGFAGRRQRVGTGRGEDPEWSAGSGDGRTMMSRRRASTSKSLVARDNFSLFSARDRSLFLLPALFLIVVLYLVPLLSNFALAFSDWSVYRPGIRWVGLDNFAGLLADGTIAHALTTTFAFAIYVMVIQNALGLALALAVEDRSRASAVFRTILFTPVLISSLAAGYIWAAILSPQGILNQALGIGTGGPLHILWLGDTTLAIIAVGFVQAWKGVGITMIIYVAGLSTIPRDLIEEAQVEGASTWQLFRRVKLPLIFPSLTFNVSLTLIGALSAFDVVVAMTGGGPARATEVLNLVIWKQFGTGLLGYATAIGLVLFFAVCLAALPLIAYLRSREVEL